MNFVTARDSISDVLESTRPYERKKFVIEQVLWSVATHEDMDSANGLIQLFDLNMFANGAHTWFDTPTAPDTRPLVTREALMAETDAERMPARKIRSKAGLK